MVLFLKYDPKDIIITLGGLIWGPMTSFSVSVIVSLIEMVTISENGILGCIMNIVSSCSFACTAAVIYKKKRTLKGAVVGLLSGSVAMVLVMMLWNYLIAPIYMGYPREAVAKLLLPAFLPFNLLKSGLNAGFTFLLYKPITTALRRTGYLSESAEVIYLHGSLRLCRFYIGRMAKNFRPVFGFPVLDLCLSLHFICLSFPASQNNKKSADKLSNGRNRNPR